MKNKKEKLNFSAVIFNQQRMHTAHGMIQKNQSRKISTKDSRQPGSAVTTAENPKKRSKKGSIRPKADKLLCDRMI